ncbi:1-(5-phosphoribosyl)-5-[(5-phosphoribosylamino)methylideneamino]imidazole-4-carboxamide isomerase [Acidaminococcus sp. CAG:542]|uniref:1-(5-phosphoribosyl)-5-[(5- phosphoribosylamino)methylideneamino]imidazole-4- carboxamide isomerase n=1 Tax=Acidaminococcus sp. CAG:542 TaxID=1262687 RepID=UPI00033B8B4F|nr:1-(5-phosphoribosyl)-5-[(5-phosphoribosylamino)methylideneamino]imidazole-4-carboxamide isomerase [Acidaminococcus sp. CAG:542]CDE93777.1 1-(5-phosphoribosyl)-5-[(5-phosphoribosylamino)methylideneamino] imidazole-4-carboxamide isomerase [Acidaminococcus sp. CAG:542]
MNIYPAIDLRGGNCVRLVKGDFSRETVYSTDPGAMAKKWADEGASCIHVVDLDGAVAGESRNLLSIDAILKQGNIPIEVGGGIRNLEHIARLLDRGVHQVILGSAAVKNPELVKEACDKYPGRIVVGIDAKNGPGRSVVGIDAKNGDVAVEGWEASGHIQAEELARKMAEAGVRRIIFTDIARDGMLSGVNVEATVNVARASGLAVTASGGVASLEDLKILKKRETDGIEGCIIGKALYTGAIDLRQAVRIAKEA